LPIAADDIGLAARPLDDVAELAQPASKHAETAASTERTRIEVIASPA